MMAKKSRLSSGSPPVMQSWMREVPKSAFTSSMMRNHSSRESSSPRAAVQELPQWKQRSLHCSVSSKKSLRSSGSR